MGHPLVWPGAPYRRHREALRFAVHFGRFQLPVHGRPLPRAGPASGRWHGCCSSGGSPRYAAGACPAPWSLSQWLCRFTFRENDYQQTLELECRHLTPCLLSHLKRWTGKCRIARWTTVAQWRHWLRCRWMPSLAWFRWMTWKLASSDAWWPSMTSSSPTTKLCSRTTRPPRQCASSAPWTASCLPRAEPGEAALRWPCIGGGMAAAGQRGRGAFCGACSHLRCCRESRTSCCGSMNLRSKAHKHSPTTRHGLQWSVLQASWRQRRRTRRWLRMPRKEALRCTRLDCRAVRRFLVAASGSAVRAPRLPRRAKIWRRSRNFEIALSAEKKSC